LKYFVKHFEVLCGREGWTYNVHGLLHLVKDSEIHGSLENYSAFKFENKANQIEKLAGKQKLPLPQIVRRLNEWSRFYRPGQGSDETRQYENQVGSVPYNLGYPRHSKYSISDHLTISDQAPNNCVITNSGERE
jgi:hypothetical protein